MVAAVVCGEELVGVRWVAEDLIKVEDGVEVAGGADPGVDGLACGFVVGARVVEA